EIPADRGSYGVGTAVVELTNKRVSDLIQQASSTNPAAGSEARKVGDYYDTYMDEAAIEAKGLTPLQPSFDRIAAIKDRKALAEELGRNLSADVDALNSTNFYTPN